MADLVWLHGCVPKSVCEGLGAVAQAKFRPCLWRTAQLRQTSWFVAQSKCSTYYTAAYVATSITDCSRQWICISL